MMNWNELNVFKKLLFGILIIIAALISPELMLFIDIGGIELAFSFLVLYYKNLIVWIHKKTEEFKEQILIFKSIVFNSAIMQPRVSLMFSGLSTVLLSLTGCFAYSMIVMSSPLFFQNTF
jgi:hypothetical protein